MERRKMKKLIDLKISIYAILLLCISTCCTAGNNSVQIYKKGAVHTHSLWSDGASLPEVAVKTFKDLGFDFVCLSDHNIYPDEEDVYLVVGEGNVPWWPNNLSRKEFERSKKLLPGSIIHKKIGFRDFVKLKTMRELRKEFEENEKFLLIGGEEVTTVFLPAEGKGRRSYHMNSFNLDANLPVIKGKTGEETIRLNYEEFLKAQEKTGQTAFFTVNHPHWQVWDIDPRMVLANPQIKFFEICNNASDETEPWMMSPEQFWDFILAHRVEDGQGVIYGIASDDSHFYDAERINGNSGCGNAYVMVNCHGKFNADNVARSMLDGDFYSTCGVHLSKVEFKNNTLTVNVIPEKDVSCKIHFIVTKKGFDRTVTEKEHIGKKMERFYRQLPVISSDIGITVAVVDGLHGSYTLKDDDLYVRAIVISDKKCKLQALNFPETERAWTQPFENLNIKNTKEK